MTGSPTIPQTARLGLHTVNRTGFGAMQLAGPRVFGPPADPAAARAVLRRAIDMGERAWSAAKPTQPNGDPP